MVTEEHYYNGRHPGLIYRIVISRSLENTGLAIGFLLAVETEAESSANVVLSKTHYIQAFMGHWLKPLIREKVQPRFTFDK